MLHKVEKEYLDDVASVVKRYVETYYRRSIEESIQNGYYDDFEYILDDDSSCCVSIMAKVKVLPDGTPNRSPDGRITLDDFAVSGPMLYFFAFCLQEGELQPHECLQTSESGDGHDTSIPSLQFSADPKDNCRCHDIAEWREYIKNKYHIFPPKLDRYFVEFASKVFRFTGGLALAICADNQAIGQPIPETLPVDIGCTSSRGVPISRLDFSTRVHNALDRANVRTVANLIDCYEQGMLAHIRTLGKASIKEIELVLCALDIPKVSQKPYIGQSKRWRYNPSDNQK